MLEKKKSKSKGMHRAKASTRQALSNSANRCLMEECDKACFRSGVQMNASKTQELREKSGWETLSLEEALSSIERMPQLPLVENIICILHKCREKKNMAYTKRLHAYVCKSGLENQSGNFLVPVFVQLGSMCDAKQVFNRLVDQNVFSWTSLIMGYIGCGKSHHALNLYQKMQEDCVHPSKYTVVAVLKACARLKDVGRGQKIHCEITREGLESDIFVGNTLVDMYAKCGLLARAQEVFDKLPVQDVISWNALMAGYSEHGLGKEAHSCFEQMRLEGISPNAVTFLCSLKACGSMGALYKGGEIHGEIARNGLERDRFIGNSLVDMYVKCHSLAKAWEVFDKLPIPNAVSWNILIAGYAELGLGDEALNCFQQMQLLGISPDSVTFVCSLKACGSIGAIDMGRKLYAEIARKGLERDPSVGNSLVDMYAKCGSLAKACEVFDNLPDRNEISWNALITGYCVHRLDENVLECFEQMQQEGVSPDAVTFVCSLKACGSIRATNNGQKMHAEIAKRGLERDLSVGNALVDMYAKCGWLAKAQEAFDMLPVQNEISWNALIAGFTEQGLGEEVLNCVEQMRQDGVPSNAFTFVCSLKACGSIGTVEKGREIHAEIARKGFETEILVGNTLVDMYTKCGALVKAQEVFGKLLVRDVVSWTALIAGYAEHGLGEEALNCFRQMQLEGVTPNTFTFVHSLKACGIIGAIDKVQELHAEVFRRMLERDRFVSNTLVDMYAKCGWLAQAQEVFDKMSIPDEVSWTALMAGYAEHGLGEEALDCFKQMQLQGVTPDASAFVCSLKACGSTQAINKGQEIHAEIARNGLERALATGNSLVDMYSKSGSLAKAWEVFDKLPVRCVVSWTALITGYTEHGLGKEALNCFEQMQLEGVSPDALTLVCSLKACGSIVAIDKGREIHARISRERLERDLLVGNTLVDMYAKCGSLMKAWEVFGKLPVRNEASWNALITGYAQLGESEIVFHMLERMRGEGLKPDGVTLLSVLSVCSHTGLLHKGQKYFETMSTDYGITPTIEHYTRMVDLLGRAGQLHKAVAMVKKMPFHPNLAVWHTVLGACRKWGNVELGRLAFEHALQLDEKDATAYVFMSNIYADAHMQEEEQKIEAMRENKHGSSQDRI